MASVETPRANSTDPAAIATLLSLQAEQVVFSRSLRKLHPEQYSVSEPGVEPQAQESQPASDQSS